MMEAVETITLNEEEFEQHFNRKPKNKKEFDKWADYAFENALNGVDWGTAPHIAKNWVEEDEEKQSGTRYRAETR